MLSYRYGAEKPDPTLFREACRFVGARPEDTLMVGDNPVKDGGVVTCGLSAYLLPATSSRWSQVPGGGGPHTTRGLAQILRLVG